MSIKHKIKLQYKNELEAYIKKFPSTGELISKALEEADYVGDLTLTQAWRITFALNLRNAEIYDIFEARA